MTRKAVAFYHQRRRSFAFIAVTLLAVAAFILPTAHVAADSQPQCVVILSGLFGCPSPNGESPTDGSHETSLDFALSWQAVLPATPNDTVTYQVCGASNSVFTIDKTCVTTTDTTVSANTVFIRADSSSTDGTWYWRVNTNGGAFSTPTSIIVDSTAPSNSGLTVSATDVSAASPPVAITGTVSDVHLQSCQVIVTNPDASRTSLPCTVDGTTGTVDTQWTVPMPSGDYSFALDATDSFGNTSTSTPVVVQVDNDPPQITFGNQNVLTADPTTPDTTVVDAHPTGITYAWKQAATNPMALSFDTAAKNPTFSPTVDGVYTFTLTATDTLGNHADSTFSLTYRATIEPVTVPSAPIAPVAKATDVTTPNVPTPTASNTTTPTSSRRGDDDDSSPAPTASTLGASTVATVIGGDTRTPGAVVPTHQGWRIFGVLWYWWLVLIGLLAAGYVIVRRRLRKNISSI